jgi:hypothetical protein
MVSVVMPASLFGAVQLVDSLGGNAIGMTSQVIAGRHAAR